MVVDSPSSAPSSEKPKNRVPLWVPISAFVGTSLALAIPLLMIRRQRGAAANRIPLKGSTAPPPRRATGSAATLSVSTSTTSSNTTVGLHETIKESLNEESTSLMSALSQMNASSGLLAAKAFAIATGMVAVGGFGMIWMAKTTFGVSDTREFGHKMRTLMWLIAPSLTSRIRRASDDDETRGDPLEAMEDWKWTEAEKRLKIAYEKGGFPLWAQMALHEVEAEARLDRIKREKEFERKQDQNVI